MLRHDQTQNVMHIAYCTSFPLGIEYCNILFEQFSWQLIYEYFLIGQMLITFMTATFLNLQAKTKCIVHRKLVCLLNKIYQLLVLSCYVQKKQKRQQYKSNQLYGLLSLQVFILVLRTSFQPSQELKKVKYPCSAHFPYN